MALLNTVEKLPTTSAEAIREFDERYLAGISAVEPDMWTEQLGDVFDVNSPDVTFPIGLMSAKYEETKGENRAKTLEEKPIRVKVAEFDAGFEAPLLHLFQNAYAWRKWQETPSRFIIAEKRFVNRQIAALLEAGTVGTSPWDDVAFFSAASHLANPAEPDVGTWGNYNSVATDPADIDNIAAEVASMMAVKDEHGERMGVRPTHILLPPEKYEPVRILLMQDQVLRGILDGAGGGQMGPTNNPYKGALEPVLVNEFTDANDWYLVDSNLMRNQGVPPWGAMRYRAPESLGLRFFDEASDFFKNTSKLKVSSHIWFGFTLLFPHAIRRIAGA